MPDPSSTSFLQPPSAPPQPPRKRRWPKILLWSCLALFVLILFAPLAAVLWLRSAAKSALPQLDGDVHLAGLSAPVTIRRDAHGVPHIEAATEDDLFIAQGFITAQDRLWQMDASRRSSNGDLAEIMGPTLIQHDKSQRILQIRLTAQRLYGRISADDRRRLDDYARGVNLFIAQCEQSNSLPVEFRLLHYRPEPWTGVDSISVVISMVQTLDTHIATKLSRGRIAAKLSNPALESDLYPVGSWRDHPPTGIKLDLSQPQGLPLAPKNDDDDEDNTESRAIPFVTTGPQTETAAQISEESFVSGHEFTRAETASQKEGALAPDPAPLNTHTLLALLSQPTCPACASGSNNWVIAGSHTASGKPLLANDMHLTLREPDTWYMADLSAPTFHAAGVTP